MNPPPHGCVVHHDVVVDHQRWLVRLRDEVEWTQHMATRRTASMGAPYNYGGASYPVTPWHSGVSDLANVTAELTPWRATGCLLNYYPTGEHRMGWHADDVSILADGTGIAILSLGATRTLWLRCNTLEGFHYEQLSLPGGSVLLMSAEMQAHWRHCIKREPTDAPRISLSFRHIVRWPEQPPPVAPRWGDATE